MRVILLTLLCLTLSQTPPPQCANLIKLITQFNGDLTELPLQTISYSGKFFNDLGNYNNCLYEDEAFTYLTLSALSKIAGTFQYIGLCVPNQCVAYMTTPKFATTVQQNLNQAFQNATQSNRTLVSNVALFNPITASPTMGIGSYLSVGLVLGLFLFQIIASIVVGIQQQKGEVGNSKGMRVIKAFSIYDNFKKIVEIKQAENQNLLFLNGLRVLSICWIIFGHDQWFRFMNLKNWMDSIDILTTPGIATLVPAAYFAVDVFFWIGGFLITIGLIAKMRNSRANPAVFYLVAVVHRFIRVWPTYMVAILIYWKIAPYLLAGPIWPAFNKLASSCNNGGVLWNMFFIDNFGDHGPSGVDYCFGWGWYLAVDFQFFLITPLMFFVYNKNKTIGFLVTFLIFLGSVITAFSMIMVNDWRYPIPNPKFAPQPDFMDKFYYKPYIRISAYIMGVWVGMFYLEWKAKQPTILKIVNTVVNSILIRTLFYIVGLTLINLTIWIVIPFQVYGNWTKVGQAFYNSLNRVGFLAGLTLVCFPAMFGCKNDPVHKILGHALFSPLAKISFCMYLVHFIVIMMGVFSNRMDLYWQPMPSIYLVMSDIFWTIILATFLSVLIQSPTLGIQKALTGGQGKKQKEPSQPKRIEFQEDRDFSKPLMSSSDRVQPFVEEQL